MTLEMTLSSRETTAVARRKKDDVEKKIWLDNLRRLSRDFLLVKGRRRDISGRCGSGPRFDEHFDLLDTCCRGLIFFPRSFLAAAKVDAH
jgi:hypothetical protein